MGRGVSAYLLDTNAYSMVLTGDPRLPTEATQHITRATRLALSVMSLYEIGQKVRLGKWPEMEPHIAGLEQRAIQDGFDLINLTASAALSAATMDWTHRDPFDRMIAATAQQEDLPLISSDTAFDTLGLTRIWG